MHDQDVEASRRPWRRPRYLVAAGVGCAALLVTGALVAQQAGGTQKAGGMRIGSTPPPGPSATPAPTPAPSTTASSAVAAPAPPAPPAAPAAAAVPSVSSSGSLKKDRHTLRVVTARGDLTGQEELAWVVDGGHPVGEARCTQ